MHITIHNYCKRGIYTLVEKLKYIFISVSLVKTNSIYLNFVFPKSQTILKTNNLSDHCTIGK